MGWERPSRRRGGRRPQSGPPGTRERISWGVAAWATLWVVGSIVLYALVGGDPVGGGPDEIGGVQVAADSCEKAETILQEARVDPAMPGPLVPMLADPPPSSGFSDATLDLELASLDHGANTQEAWRAALEQFGFVRGWRRDWLISTVDGIPTTAHEEVVQLGSADDATGFQRWVIRLGCRSMADVFRVDDVPGGVGADFRWSDGHRSEQVSFVAGDLRIVVWISQGLDPPEPGEVEAFARSAFQSAELGRPCQPWSTFQTTTDATVRPRSLARLVPPRIEGLELVERELDPRFRLPEGEEANLAAGTWRRDSLTVRVEILQFHSNAGASEWGWRSLSEGCAAGADTLPGPLDLVGSSDVQLQHADGLVRTFLFVIGPRLYRVELAGPNSEQPPELVQTVVATVAAAAA